MGLNKVIELAAILAILAASTGQLPHLIREVQVAQLHLLKASQTKRWGQALLFPHEK
jgi:hypothetical protein